MVAETLHSTPAGPISATLTRPPRLSVYVRFIKLSHGLFSLPLLFAGALLAGPQAVSWPLAAWILAAGFGARTVGMTFNRIADRRIDAANPRTACRALPTGAMRLSEAWLIAGGGLFLYVVAAAAISPLCLALSPIPIALFAVYPHLKRFTIFSHVGLGVAWATAPLGGWVAAAGTASATAPVLWLAAFSILWVAGFDIIYATMDETFDRSHGLHSLPARLGSRRALRVAALLHLAAFGCLAALWLSLDAEATPGALAHWLSLDAEIPLRGSQWMTSAEGTTPGALAHWRTLGHPLGLAPLAIAAALLVAEHRLRDRAVAFFPVNVLIGCAVLALVATYRAGGTP